MAPVRLSSVRLVGEVRIDQGATCGGACARREHPGWGAVPPWDHGELVRPGRGAVVQIGSTAGLEGPSLVLRGAGVGRRQVGVVVGGGGHAQGHTGGDGGGRVGEGGRVVHPWVGEAALSQRGEAGELTLKLPWVSREWAQIRGTCHGERNSASQRRARRPGSQPHTHRLKKTC